jgi:hypothetical protein
MQNLWHHNVRTTGAIYAVKTEHSGLKAYWNLSHHTDQYWTSLWVGNLIADAGDPDERNQTGLADQTG